MAIRRATLTFPDPNGPWEVQLDDGSTWQLASKVKKAAVRAHELIRPDDDGTIVDVELSESGDVVAVTGIVRRATAAVAAHEQKDEQRAEERAERRREMIAQGPLRDKGPSFNPYTHLPYMQKPPPDRWGTPTHRTNPEGSEDRHSGHLQLLLTVVTPLATFGGDHEEQATHVSKRDTASGGFSYTPGTQNQQKHRHTTILRDDQGRPWIQGSSVRGAARSWFEVITSSERPADEQPVAWRGRLHLEDGRPLTPGSSQLRATRIEPLRQIEPPGGPHRGTPKERMRAVLQHLAAHGWVSDDLRDGQEVGFQRPDARLKVGVAMGRDPDVSVQVVVDDPSHPPVPVEEEMLQRWQQAHKDAGAVGERTERKRIDSKTLTVHRPNPGKLSDGQLVWYETDDAGAVCYLGVLRNGRWSEPEPLAGRVPAAHRPPGDGRLSPADRVFGTAGEHHGEQPWASRVRVGPAVLVPSGDVETRDYTLLPLSSPKLGSAGMYLHPKQGDHVAWTEGDAVLAGTKVYWHAVPEAWEPADARVRRAVDADGQRARTTQNTTVEALAQGELTCTVHFEDLCEVELGALLLAVGLRFIDDDARRGWKLGLGKPVGLGSVENAITGLWIDDEAALVADPFTAAATVGEAPDRFVSAALAYYLPRTEDRRLLADISGLDTMKGAQLAYPGVKDPAFKKDAKGRAKRNNAARQVLDELPDRHRR